MAVMEGESLGLALAYVLTPTILGRLAAVSRGGEAASVSRTTPGLRQKKKVGGRWMKKTMQDMIADLTMKQNADRTLGTLGLSEKTTVDCRWVQKNLAGLIADLTALTNT